MLERLHPKSLSGRSAKSLSTRRDRSSRKCKPTLLSHTAVSLPIPRVPFHKLRGATPLPVRLVAFLHVSFQVVSVSLFYHAATLTPPARSLAPFSLSSSLPSTSRLPTTLTSPSPRPTRRSRACFKSPSFFFSTSLLKYSKTRRRGSERTSS